MTGDLHCHTTFSDGSEKPSQIIKYAQKFGVGCVAITDHDCLGGVEQAKRAAAGTATGIRVIGGVELSTYDYKNGKKVHILCYEPQKKEELLKMCTETLRRRQEASLAILEKLRRKYPLDLETAQAFQADSPILYKQHIMAALMHMGYTVSIFGPLYNELFSRSEGWARVEPRYPEAREVLKLASESGGVCVLAHPGVYHNFDILEELLPLGLQGIEVWHPRQPDSDSQKAEAFAREHGLLMTGGTDFHGAHSSQPIHFASKVTPAAHLSEIFTKLSAQGLSASGV